MYIMSNDLYNLTHMKSKEKNMYATKFLTLPIHFFTLFFHSLTSYLCFKIVRIFRNYKMISAAEEL